MKQWRQFVADNSLVIFFILTYILSWALVFQLQGSLLPHGPMLAAIIVLAVTVGRRGLADFWKRLTHSRVSWIWYMIAPGIIVLIHFFATVLNLLLGATIIFTNLNSWSTIGLLIVQFLLLGGEWEEPGWSGFALPRLQERFAGYPGGMLIASLILGALRAVWHIPLVIYGHIPWYDMLFFSFAMQFLISWVYNRSGGSLPIVMLLHLASNFFFALTRPLFTGADTIRYSWLFIVAAWLIVLLIYRLPGLKLAGSKTRASGEIYMG